MAEKTIADPPALVYETTPGEKEDYKHVDVESTEDVDSEFAVLHDERDIVTNVVSISDDPSLNPWTFRAVVIGIGLSAFGGVLGTSVLTPLSCHGLNSFHFVSRDILF